MFEVFALFGAFFLVTAVIPHVYTFSVNFDMVDRPGPRKVHQTPIPFVGGVAMWLGVLLAIWFLPVENSLKMGLTLGGTVAFAVGFADDFIKSRGGDLAALPKLVGHVVSAGLLIAAGVRVQFLSNPFGGGMVHLSPLQSYGVTILWVVGVINIINFMDGLDGLACGIVGIAATTMAVVSFLMGQHETMLISLVVVGVTVAFLRFNFNPASMFMGDAGSYFLGFMLAAVSVEGAFKSATLAGLAVPILVLGLPIADTAYSIIRRFRNGQPIYVADKGHTHHRLLNAGFNQRQTVLVMYLISICFSLTALAFMVASRT